MFLNLIFFGGGLTKTKIGLGFQFSGFALVENEIKSHFYVNLWVYGLCFSAGVERGLLDHELLVFLRIKNFSLKCCSHLFKNDQVANFFLQISSHEANAINARFLGHFPH